jgi:hypothetical protein
MKGGYGIAMQPILRTDRNCVSAAGYSISEAAKGLSPQCEDRLWGSLGFTQPPIQWSMKLTTPSSTDVKDTWHGIGTVQP